MDQESKLDPKKEKSKSPTFVKAVTLQVKAKAVRFAQKVKHGLNVLLTPIRRLMPTWRHQNTVKIPTTPKKPKVVNVKDVKPKAKAKPRKRKAKNG